MTNPRRPNASLPHEDLARAHESGLGAARRRWRGSSLPRGGVARDAQRAQSARLALAQLLYGGPPVR